VAAPQKKAKIRRQQHLGLAKQMNEVPNLRCVETIAYVGASTDDIN